VIADGVQTRLTDALTVSDNETLALPKIGVGDCASANGPNNKSSATKQTAICFFMYFLSI